MINVKTIKVDVSHSGVGVNDSKTAVREIRIMLIMREMSKAFNMLLNLNLGKMPMFTIDVFMIILPLLNRINI
jgi:hypothetical protein